MLDPERSLHVLRELRELGIGIHVDDFGTGYSSLSYLRRLPVTRVKIDRSFVSADGLDKLVDPAIAGAIISLAHQLNVKVIAEGVETLTQLLALQNLGCDSIQGYFISCPVPAAKATAFIERSDLPIAS
jgi:EAL domain-containing protein (putative c-di-GMP-specific phosphodiesterase class I)